MTDESDKKQGITRNEFLKGAAAATTVALLASGCGSREPTPPTSTPTPETTRLLLDQIAALEEQIKELKQETEALRQDNTSLQTKLAQSRGEPTPEIKEPEPNLTIFHWLTPQSEPRPGVEELPILEEYPLEGFFGPSRLTHSDGDLAGVIEGQVIIVEDQYPLPKTPGLGFALESLSRKGVNNRPLPFLLAEQSSDTPVKSFHREAVFKAELVQPNQAPPQVVFQNNERLDLSRPPIKIDGLPRLDDLQILYVVDLGKKLDPEGGAIDTARVLLLPRRHEGQEIITPQSYLFICKETDPGSWHQITGIEAVHLREIRIPNSEDAEIRQAIGTEGVVFGIPGFTETTLTQEKVRPKENWAIIILDPDRKPIGVKKITLDPDDFLSEPQLI